MAGQSLVAFVKGAIGSRFTPLQVGVQRVAFRCMAGAMCNLLVHCPSGKHLLVIRYMACIFSFA